MAQSAFKKYSINDFGPGDILTESLNTTLGAFGATTIRWQRIGKLYFALYFTTGGGLQPLFDSDSTTQAEVASILGITIDTAYVGTNYGSYIGEYNGTWNATPPGNSTRNVLWGFLIN